MPMPDPLNELRARRRARRTLQHRRDRIEILLLSGAVMLIAALLALLVRLR